MLTFKKKLIFLTLIIAIILAGCFGLTGRAQAEYYSAGTSTSANLLSNVPPNRIDSFYYNASSIPDGTALKFRFSTTSSSGPWVNATGSPDSWTKATTAGGATTSLSDFDWISADDFYYQARFESDANGSTTPALDTIRLAYTNLIPDTPYDPSPADGTKDTSLSPTLSVKVHDEDGDSLIVSFYDGPDDSLIATTSVAATTATSTASVTWNDLSASTTYDWYAKAYDGEATSSASATWSFTTHPAPPDPTALSQYKDDCSTVIATSSWVEINSICFESQIATTSAWKAKMQLDYSSTTLDGIPDVTSSSWCSGSCTSTITNTLARGPSYKWQVRAVDEQGATSSWVHFNPGGTAFGLQRYYTEGTSTSADLLSNIDLNTVNSFYYDIASLPATTTVKFRYSTTSASGPWVNSSGITGGWDEVTTTGGATTSLTNLNWDSIDSFYYQARLESGSHGSSTPALNKIRLSYVNCEPDAPSDPSPADGTKDTSLSPTLSVKVHDQDGDSLNVSFYDVAAGTLIGTTSVAGTSAAATSTASITWSGLDAGTAYSWYVKVSDGEATTTSGVWSFTTYQPPAFPSDQYQGDCSTTMAVSSWVDITTICFGAQIIPNDNHDVKLQLDYSTSATFDGVPDATSSIWQSSTSTVTITQSSLPRGQSYKWQVRTVDDGGAVSEWTKFNSGNMAFGISEYYSVGTSTSANLLSGKNVDIINTFYYDATSLPAGTALKFRFATSSTSGPWYNAQGVQGAWSKARTTGGAVFDLEDLGWSGSNFYYQARFEADYTGLYSPALDLIKVEYNENAVRIEGGERIFRNIQIKQ